MSDTTELKTLNIRIRVAVYDQLIQAAKERGLSANWLAAKAIENFLPRLIASRRVLAHTRAPGAPGMTSAWDCHRLDLYDDGPVVRCRNCDWVSLTPEQVLALADRLTAAVLDRYAAVCDHRLATVPAPCNSEASAHDGGGPFGSGGER